MTQSDVRVRFAPSPTGPLHIGGVRTALFNYLFARKHKGTFILRIEDTDQTRFVPQAESYIIESLKWAGITIDEGIGASPEGDLGPYRQSERKNLYRNFAFDLIASGDAYYAFDTPEELQTLRADGDAQKTPFVYNYETRSSLYNSLTLSKEETAQKIAENVPYVIRFKIPENKKITIPDIVRGTVTFDSKELDDKILYKSDGLPTYHLANVVDDYTMGISHVIRGEEWLSSLPLHVLLYRAFGWENNIPDFAHLPLILKPQGQGKLSKRDGDKMGFPVFPLEWTDDSGQTSTGYRENGYLPEAFINMLSLLGWNPGTEQELFTMEELIEAFSLERVGKSGSKFDPEKTKWFNHIWLQKKPLSEISTLCEEIVTKKGYAAEANDIEKICALVRERMNFVQDFWDHAFYFFQAPQEYNTKVVKKRWKNDAPQAIEAIKNILSEIADFSAEQTEKAVKEYISSEELNMGQIMNCLRLSIVGNSVGVDLFEIMAFIGKEESVQRITKALEVLPSA
ncbi:MAG: glutamate--tRNA ligase [Bacteroidales bacterium]|jgi:glutamyl-tRNA synthetase|nr:glutamate--tRNA ligase [Bacteroidales bacterium]